MTFAELEVPPSLVAALAKQGITEPTDIQVAALPALLAGKDAYINSETGTGKTLAYLLPLFCRIDLKLEATQVIVVVPTHELAEAVAYCGKASGRDRDKFADSGLTITPSRHVRAPIVEQCVVHYECRAVHRNDLAPAAITQAIIDQFYPRGDFHRVYFGEIVAAYADENAARLLAPQGGLTIL